MLIKTNQRIFNKKKMNLRINPFFGELLFYLIEKKEEKITLKDIKRKFQNVSSLNSFLDELIEFGIINRYHGRYSFSGVFITQKEQSEINEITTRELDVLSENIRETVGIIKSQIPHESFNLSLIFHLFDTIDQDSLAIYEETELSETWLNLPTRVAETKSKNQSFISMGNFLSIYDNNIADYFNFLTLKQTNLPQAYHSLYMILGDLNISYFLKFVTRQLRRLEKAKKIQTKTSNIFMEALCFTNFIDVDGDFYRLNTKQIITDVDWSNLDELINLLTKNADYVSTSFHQKSFMVKSIFIVWLIENKLLALPTNLNGVL